MTRRQAVVVGGVCALVLVGGYRDALAQPVTGPINVTALPLPNSNCPGLSASAIPNDRGSGTLGLDTDAFLCAISLVPASGGEIYIPAGTYHLANTLHIGNKNIAFRGEGQRITILEWEATNQYGNGIEFRSTSGSVNHTLNVRSLSILRAEGHGGAGISAAWQAPGSSPMDYGGTSATLFDVHVSITSPGRNWSHGIYLANAVGARISSFNVDGWQAGNDSASIMIDGKSIDVTISDGNMGKADKGVWVAAQSEHVRVENVETSQNAIGFFFQTTGKHNSITNCHAGVVTTGIQFNDSSDAIIVGNFLLLVHTGIIIWNPAISGARFQVRDNLVIGDEQQNDHLIKIQAYVSEAIVMGNQVRSSSSAGQPSTLKTILLDANVSNSIVTGNYIRGYAVVDYGTNNLLANNY